MAICILCEENELSPRSKLTTCSNCRASMGIWGRRPTIEVLNRRRKLHIYDMRMENVVINPGNIRAVPLIRKFVTASQLKKQAREERKTNGKK